jgi:hypothetical protein
MGRTADSLVEAVMLDMFPSHPAITDFGIKSQEHYEALYQPIREGVITADQLHSLAGAGEEITNLVSKYWASQGDTEKAKIVFTTFWDRLEIEED